MPVVMPPLDSGSARGYYAAQADVENLYGTTNVATYSNLAGEVTADAVRIQAALDYADGEINDHFTGGQYVIPLPVTAKTTNWGATIAGEWLYRARGFRDDDPVGNKIKSDLKAVRAEMASVKSGRIVIHAHRKWPTPTAPVGW